ncbi:MAG: hypothetical protein ABW135_08835 [Thermoleophilaceae bacterium]
MAVAAYHQLDDADWLAARRGEGMSAAKIAAAIGSSESAVRRRLVRHGLNARPGYQRNGEQPPVPLEEASAGHADLSASVASDELARHLDAGLRDLVRLVDLADTTSVDSLWDTVIAIDPAHARRIVLCAATVASRQRRKAGEPGGHGGPRESPIGNTPHYLQTKKRRRTRKTSLWRGWTG